MAKKHNFLEEDEYSSYYEEEVSEKEEAFRRKNAKGPKKSKDKHKGHQSKHMSHSARALEEEYLNNLTATEEIPSPRPKTRLLGGARAAAETEACAQTSYEAPQTTPSVPKFTFGPNSHEVKGNMIDFDRVVDIQKTEAEHNGHNTFGIKFLFAGKKGLYRIAWFNWNVKERDKVYDTEYAYWTSLRNSSDLTQSS